MIEDGGRKKTDPAQLAFKELTDPVALESGQDARLEVDGRVQDEGPVAVPMRATAITLSAGEALRLSVAAASFPAYPVDPDTGADPTATAAIDARVITLGVHAGGPDGSWLDVGVLGELHAHASDAGDAGFDAVAGRG